MVWAALNYMLNNLGKYKLVFSLLEKINVYGNVAIENIIMFEP